VPEETRHFNKEFYAASIERLTQNCKMCVIMVETLWENSLNFVKDAPMIYVHLIIVVIIIVIIVSEKERGSMTFILCVYFIKRNLDSKIPPFNKNFLRCKRNINIAIY
jgi:hypothetical protein